MHTTYIKYDNNYSFTSQTHPKNDAGVDKHKTGQNLHFSKKTQKQNL